MIETEFDLLKNQIPAPLNKILDPATPVQQRAMAAKGLVPASPQVVVCLLVALTQDSDQQIAALAMTTLGKLPPPVLQGALAFAELSPLVLDALAQVHKANDAIIEQVLLHRNTSDPTFERLAGVVNERLTEIVAGNQQRIMRHPAIAVALTRNPLARKSAVDMTFDFLVRRGIVLDVPEYIDALGRLSPTDQKEAVDKIELPRELIEAGLLQEREEDTKAQTAAQPLGPDGEEPEESEEQVRKRIPIIKLMNTLNTAQKIALALKGNKEARNLLIKDSNRLVATATIRSPRITEMEVAAAAASRSSSDDVIRIIANSNEMTRNYSVKVALCTNPKTPLTVAMKLLHHLRKNDLKMLSKSKNVPSALSNMAKNMGDKG